MKISMVNLVIKLGKAITNNEARRIINQGMVSINGELVITQSWMNVNELTIELQQQDSIRIGKTVFTMTEELINKIKDN